MIVSRGSSPWAWAALINWSAESHRYAGSAGFDASKPGGRFAGAVAAQLRMSRTYEAPASLTRRMYRSMPDWSRLFSVKYTAVGSPLVAGVRWADVVPLAETVVS